MIHRAPPACPLTCRLPSMRMPQRKISLPPLMPPTATPFCFAFRRPGNRKRVPGASCSSCSCWKITRSSFLKVDAMTDLKTSINAFFDSYRAAFERRNVGDIADHFAYPGFVTSDAGEITLVPITNRQEWLGKLE